MPETISNELKEAEEDLIKYIRSLAAGNGIYSETLIKTRIELIEAIAGKEAFYNFGKKLFKQNAEQN